MVSLCKPKENFIFEKAYATIDEPVSRNLLFRRDENYAFTREKVPLYSFSDDSCDYVIMVCVFYSNSDGAELVRFAPEEFNKKFEFMNYTSW